MNTSAHVVQSAAPSFVPTVAVIVVNWNGMLFLPACLLALSRQAYPSAEIVVVDNGSTDGSIAYLEQCHPHVRIIPNTQNIGFAAACNQGIRATAAEYVVLLNNDTVVHPQWLAAMVAAMDDPAVGMCACRMLSMHDANVIDSTGIAVDRLGYAWGIGGGAQDEPDNYPGPHQLLGPSGGAGLYRRQMLDDIGLFDEDFFAYLEDVDIAWRAQWAGWQCRFAADAIVFHVHSATVTQVPHLKSRLLARNRIWMIAKNYPTRCLLAYLPLLMLSEIGALVYLARRGRFRSSLRGRLEAIRRIPAMLNKRTQTPHRITNQQMMARLQPVELPTRLLQRYRFVAHKQS
ncbi:MAG: glycosyltransferase family 2 protein [Caldilinea sp.]